MKGKILTLLSAIMSGIISLLGFSACSNEIMYGSPHGDFKVSGLVKSESGQPIQNVRIIIRKWSPGKDYLYVPGASDTVMTNVKGMYYDSGESSGETRMRVVCEDPSGAYESDSVEVRLDYKGGDHDWYIGKAEATADFTLRKAEEKPADQ